MLTPQDIFQFIAYATIAAALAGLLILLVIIWTVVSIFSRRGKRLRNNLIATPLTLLAAFAWAYIASSDDRARQREMQAKAEARQKEYLESKAIFAERCKSAGEKIYQTVENVEGITLLNIPKERMGESRNNPMWENAALPWASEGIDYIRTFLDWDIRNEDSNRTGTLVQFKPKRRNERTNNKDKIYSGYHYVDVRQGSYIFRRYYFSNKREGTSENIILSEPIKVPSRYMIEYKPIIDPKDRKHWIAGLTVNIYDSQTNILMATKTWFAMDPMQGTDTHTSSWFRLDICPIETGGEPIRFFTTHVIKPKGD